MITKWTKAEMDSILVQLNNYFYPFKKYVFSKKDSELILLGSGGYAVVYEMESINNPHKKFAVKILGFAERHVDYEEYLSTVQMQEKLGTALENVVKVVEHTELCVRISGMCQVDDIVKIPEKHGEIYDIPNGNVLILRFILMEKMTPVLTRDKRGVPKLYPESLANFEQSEIMKFAHDIGIALMYMHDNNLLHRDVKLENVFYDSDKKVYKLGDFGIAKLTDDGTACSIAYTNGYGAPEVSKSASIRYDNTADIYSYGIMLYLLLNELKFPDSEAYKVNSSAQYSNGYKFPEPECAYCKLWPMVDKMCQYDPDDRYQSMENILNDIEIAEFGEDIRYKRENTRAMYVAGMLCYVFGMVMWKLTHMPELALDIGFGEYAFLLAGGYIYWLNLKKKKHYVTTIVVLIFGVLLLILTGFNWWKLLFILCVSFSMGSVSGMACLGVLIVDLISRIMMSNSQLYISMQQYNWVALLFFSFSVFLLLQYETYKLRDIKLAKLDCRKNFYWIIVMGLYAMILLNGLVYLNNHVVVCGIAWLDKISNLFYQFRNMYNCILLGICGIGLSGGWMIREKILKKMNLLKGSQL